MSLVPRPEIVPQWSAGGFKICLLSPRRWSNTYFPNAVNFAKTHDAAVALGGTLQPLTLDVTVGGELARET